MTQPGAGRWGDLPKRMASAAVMICVGIFEIWIGGAVFAAFVVALTAVMVWELSKMTNPEAPTEAIWLALLAACAMAAALQFGLPLALVFLATVPLALLFPALPDRGVYASYAAMIMLAGFGLTVLRDQSGPLAIFWLVGTVIVSDVMGYFAGRSLGGPKFWPAISPKKTWSGTLAGWIGAAAFGGSLVAGGHAGWGLVPISVLIAFAGQMGDIAESWIKRRNGVKDSSALIPGHGGVLDRFDAMIAAVAAVMILTVIVDLPFTMTTGN